MVAIPIGNMGDLTPRAKGVLEAADHLFCEDTRVAKRLLAASGTQSKARLRRLDQHSSESDVREQLERVEAGSQLVFVSDAGTPGINDPGALLVRVCRDMGYEIVPVPGPSAYITLFSVSGWEVANLLFKGFFPRKSGEIKQLLAELDQEVQSTASFWFESPKRIAKTLSLIQNANLNGRWILGKELTKKFEWITEGEISEVMSRFEALEKKELGEWCVGYENVASRPESLRQTNDEFLNFNYVKSSQQNWDQALRCLIDSGISISQGSKIVSQYFGIPKNDAYELGLKIKSEKISNDT